MDDPLRLSSSQVAARLHIKVETLYAYVARGLLVSQRGENGESSFDPLDVEEFADSRRGTAGTGVSSAGMRGRPLMVLESNIALIDNDRLYFRGLPVEQLAHRLQFEDAVEFLWQMAPPGGDTDVRFSSRRDVVAAVRRAIGVLGPSARLIDHLTVAVVVAGSWDPERTDTGPEAVRDAGRQMIATMVDSLADVGGGIARDAPLAARLWSKLSGAEATPDRVRLLNSAMVLSMDHDLATSTMGARVAASSRANPYAAVAAALSSFDGPLHGAASIAAVDMLTEVMSTGNAERAISRQLGPGGVIPGFGHLIYRHDDPRARFLLSAMRQTEGFSKATLAADRLAAVVASRSSRVVNVDLALAALVVGADMRPDAGELIFAISRTAGWIAHIIDEYAKPALRLRPESRYTGPRPQHGG